MVVTIYRLATLPALPNLDIPNILVILDSLSGLPTHATPDNIAALATHSTVANLMPNQLLILLYSIIVLPYIDTCYISYLIVATHATPDNIAVLAPHSSLAFTCYILLLLVNYNTG